MNKIQVTASLMIHDGKLEEFKTIAQACIESVREKDKGTLQYDWFFNEDNTECVVREQYVDSNAVLEHIANLGETMGALLALADLSLEVYGRPSEELVKATEGMDIRVYSYFQGL
jgi:quinol monooxygenase YgiN